MYVLGRRGHPLSLARSVCSASSRPGLIRALLYAGMDVNDADVNAVALRQASAWLTPRMELLHNDVKAAMLGGAPADRVKTSY
jgi:hypothetical protein